MTTFAETNCEIHDVGAAGVTVYAACHAGNCTWVGPIRSTEAAAKRDAVRHHDSDTNDA